MGKKQQRTINPQDVLGYGRNGEFRVAGYRVTGLGLHRVQVVNVRIESKTTRNNPNPDFESPIQFTGKPEAILKLLEEIVTDLYRLTTGNFRLEKPVIYREEDANG